MQKFSVHTRRVLLSAAFLAALLLTGCRLSRPIIDRARIPEKSIVILYENDVHCILDGYPVVAGMRQAMSDTSYVKLVSSGDFLSGGTLGAMSKGEYVMQVVRAMDYDAMTFGNHEFDFRVPHLMHEMQGMEGRLTCANFVNLATGSTVFPEMIVTEAGNRKIAFIGVTTPSTLNTMPTAFEDEEGHRLYDLVPQELYDRVQRAVNHARRVGADYVFVLSHLGEVDEATSFHITSQSLVANTSGIDAVLDGHSHSLIRQNLVANKDGEMVTITQTGTKMTNIGKVVIMPDGKMDFSLPALSNQREVDDRVLEVVEAVKAEAEAKTSRVVGYSEVDMVIKRDGREVSRTGETNATNLVTDAYRVLTGADVAILNAGSVRNAIKAGPLTYGDLLGLLPYDNWLTTAEATGAQLVAAIEQNVVSLPRPDGQFPVVSGMRYTVNQTTHEVTNVQVLDKTTGQYVPIDPQRTYTIVSTHYALYDGGLRKALIDTKPIKKQFAHYCDAFVEYVTEVLGGRITSERYGGMEGRIEVIE